MTGLRRKRFRARFRPVWKAMEPPLHPPCAKYPALGAHTCLVQTGGRRTIRLPEGICCPLESFHIDIDILWKDT